MVRVADALAASGVAYLLAGSFSSNYYGIPRSTKDADFVVELRGGVGRDFMARLGADFEAEPHRRLVRTARHAGAAGRDSPHGAEALTVASPTP